MYYLNSEQQREYQAAMDQESMSQGEYMSEALYQHSAVYGADRPADRWVLSPFDTWETNPCWDGTEPYQPHPEDEDAQEEYYLVGQHAVNLYEADKYDRLDAAEYANDDDFPF